MTKTDLRPIVCLTMEFILIVDLVSRLAKCFLTTLPLSHGMPPTPRGLSIGRSISLLRLQNGLRRETLRVREPTPIRVGTDSQKRAAKL
jgi:hypothetical protein